jgi:hypothetical protein
VIILPSDPNALVQRLSLSIAAGHAGNIASRNEAVAICDELLRQGEINKEGISSRFKNTSRRETQITNQDPENIFLILKNAHCEQQKIYEKERRRRRRDCGHV